MKQLYLIFALMLSLVVTSQNDKIDELTVKLAYQAQDSTKVETSLLLIDELLKVEAYDKALLFINQTSELSENINYEKGVAETTFYKARIYSERNDYLNAIENYRASKTYFQQLQDTLGVAKVNNQIGLIEIKRGNYAFGLQHALSAIPIFEDRNLDEELSVAYNNLADAYYNTNQLDKALDYSTKTLQVRERLNDENGIKQTLITIAKIHFDQNNYTRAITFYERALNRFDPETDQELRGSILPQIGMSYLKLNNQDKAAEYLVEGLKYNRRINNDKGVLESLNAVADLNLKQKNFRTAENQIVEAYRIATRTDNQQELLANYRLRIALDSSRGRFQNAFYWQNQFYDLKEELSRNTIPVIIPEINEAEPIQMENPIVSDPPDNSETKTSNPILIYGLIAGLLVSLALLIFMYLKNDKDKKQLEELRGGSKSLKIENKHLKEETAQLKEVNQVKDKLFSIVSHDLKDSISSIKAFLDLLKDDAITKEEFNQLIPELSENANNASSLLFNLLNWSKSQLQNLNPKPELFNIQEVFQTKIALVDKKVVDKGIMIIDESRRDFVYADRSMLEIVIQNLITNAVKFSGKGDVITVSNQDYNGNALICVEDTGIGISQENIEKLFNARNNFTTVGTKNEKGTGLGLTIAKDLVELNNGRIWVESTPNIGSKFFIELPKAALGSKPENTQRASEKA
ncbi:ATP-binding protein [Winogradskyella sp. A3E31]|uniref:tetratricopeptide repeat-containing sensor histidine kinase n=1 Tax=Winogradskyella sp. A3E31 TaxID=3349637 RepID=UPI00398B8099